MAGGGRRPGERGLLARGSSSSTPLLCAFGDGPRTASKTSAGRARQEEPVSTRAGTWDDRSPRTRTPQSERSNTGARTGARAGASCAEVRHGRGAAARGAETRSPGNWWDCGDPDGLRYDHCRSSANAAAAITRVQGGEAGGGRGRLRRTVEAEKAQLRLARRHANT